MVFAVPTIHFLFLHDGYFSILVRGLLPSFNMWSCPSISTHCFWGSEFLTNIQNWASCISYSCDFLSMKIYDFLQFESKPVDLNTMNPTIWTNFFFTYKGVRATFGVASGNSSRPPRELNFFLVSPMTYSNGKMQRANSNSKILFFWTPLLNIFSSKWNKSNHFHKFSVFFIDFQPSSTFKTFFLPILTLL